MTLSQPPDLATTFLLVRRAKRGERDALGELLQRYYPRVAKIVKLRLGRSISDNLDVTDILQETFVEAIKAFDNFELRNEASVINWLSRIAQRRIMAASVYLSAKKRGRDKQVAMDAGSSGDPAFEVADERRGPLTSASTREESEIVEECIGELPERYREILVLREYLGYSWEDVAREHGRPTEDAARKLHAAAILKLNERVRQKLG